MIDILFFIILLIAGFTTGVVDAVAGGGNLFSIAILGLSGLPALPAVATTRIISLVQNSAASVAFEKQKLINWEQALIFLPFAVIGSFLGAEAALHIAPDKFSHLVGAMMIGLLFVIPSIRQQELSFNRLLTKIFRKFSGKRPLVAHSKKQTFFLIILSFILGFYGGFHGGGVGSMMLISFYAVGGGSILSTAATTKIIDISFSLVAAGLFLIQPDLISWQHAIPLIIGTLFGSFLGVDWAEKLGYQYIRILMFIVVLSSAVRYIFFS